MTGIDLSALEIRVTDKARAYRFYDELFAWTLPDHTTTPASASRIETLFTDDRSAPAVRLWFESDDPATTLVRFRKLGGNADDTSDCRDAHGIPVGFRSRQKRLPGKAARGELGVVIVGAAETAKARRFYGGLCGWTFHQIRQDDRWWTDHGPVGFFQASLMNIDFEPSAVPRDIVYFYAVPELDRSLEAVRRLGGRTLAPAMMGPNPVCGGYDDQGTRFGLCVIPG